MNISFTRRVNCICFLLGIAFIAPRLEAIGGDLRSLSHEVVRGRWLPLAAGTVYPTNEASPWIFEVMKPEFQPKNFTYMMQEGSAEKPDALATIIPHQEFKVQIIQTWNSYLVVASGEKIASLISQSASETEAAGKLAHRLFVDVGPRFELQTTNSTPERTEGTAPPFAATPEAARQKRGLYRLNYWWSSGDQIGFASSKMSPYILPPSLPLGPRIKWFQTPGK